MKITILGTANAWGPNEFLGTPWPLTGELDNGEAIQFRKYRTSLFIETADGKRVLVDCGPDFSHQRRDFNIGKLDAILITHPHPDHVGGLDELNVYRPAQCTPIPTYALPECWQCIKAVRGFAHVVDALKLVAELELKPFQPISIGSLTTIPFAVEHSQYAPGAVGFVFVEDGNHGMKRVVYTGDLWAICNPEHELFKHPVDLLICECDRWKGLAGPSVGGGHMSFEEAIRCLKDGVFSRPRPRQVTFVHFGDNGPNGPASTYVDWRISALAALDREGLACVAPDPNVVVAYEGITFQF